MANPTMRAVLFTSPGGPLELRELATPRPSQGQVLVKVLASGLNPLDVKIWEGLAAHARQPPPAVLGIDAAGIVVATADGVEDLAVGDEVFGMTGGVGGLQGSLAEFVAVDADLLARSPAGLDWRAAAALPLAFITAWEGLVDRAALRPGQTVLIQGGAGGVGHVAVQLAKARGATVFATGSPSRRADIERLGATFIDRREPVADYVARLTAGVGFEVIYDTAGGEALDASFQAVARFGHVVSSLGWGVHSLAPLSFQAASYSGVFTLIPLLTGERRHHHRHILREAARLADEGLLAPIVDPRRYALETAAEALSAIKAGTARSKLVVDVAGP